MKKDIVYISDEGHILDENDFIQYVLFKINEAKINNQRWEDFLNIDWWGDNLLNKGVLNKICY